MAFVSTQAAGRASMLLRQGLEKLDGRNSLKSSVWGGRAVVRSERKFTTGMRRPSPAYRDGRTSVVLEEDV